MLKGIFRKKEEECTDGEIVLKVSEDELKASILIKGPKGGGYEPTLAEASNAITKKGIMFGIDQNLLMRLFERKMYDKEFIFAKGKPLVQTKQGKIKYFFKANPDMRPIEDKKGNLDYKNVKLIQTVKEEDKLCEFIPPVRGTAGKTITGKVIQPKEVVDIKMPSGVNVMRDPEDENVLLASIDGTVKKSGDVIEVTAILHIKSDVDFSTGNIESRIATKIFGDVKSTFSVKVDRDLEVLGVIEDAEVSAGGAIFARAGIIGRGNGKISAGDNISARSCQKASIISKKDIIISERVSDSTIIAEGKIKINARRSEIFRCKLIAKDGIEVRNIGNDNYDPAEVIVGMPAELYLESETLNIRIKQTQQAVDRASKDLKLAHKMQAFRAGARKETIANIRKNYAELVRQLDDLKGKKESIDAQIKAKMNRDASFIVFDKIFPRITVNIRGKKIKPVNEQTLVEFKYGEEELEIVNLKEKYDRFEIQRMMLGR